MRQILILLLFSIIGLFAAAQSKTNSTTPVATTKPNVSTKPVINSTINSFETDITYGKLILSKTTKQEGNADLITSYKVFDRNDRTFNNKKPLVITLTKQSFTTTFSNTTTEMAAKLPLLLKYIDDNKLVLTEEKGWIYVINYYNSLF